MAINSIVKVSQINIITGLLVLAGLISIAWWLGKDPVRDFVTTEPGLDNRGAKPVVPDIQIGEYFEAPGGETDPGQIAGLAEATGLTGTWPRFRGEYFDNISRSDIGLIDRFPEGGPVIRWQHEMGEGYAGAAVYKGLVYVLDHDEELRADVLRCFRLDTGEELWRRGYYINIKRNHGMSRTIPAVTEKYVLTLGPRGHVMCTDRITGDFRWGLNVALEYGGDIPLWNTGQCPLEYEGKAIIATGGKSLVVALDMETGELLWETPNPKGWQMSHSSIIPWEYRGIKMFVYSSFGGACGIAADGEREGQILWETAAWNHQTVAPSPLCFDDGKVYLTAGYGAGSMVLQLTGEGPDFGLEVVAEFSPREGLASEQQTPVVYNGYVIGVQPKDAGALRNQMICVHPSDFTRVVWGSGGDIRFGLGPYMIADGKMFLVDDDGTLVIIRPRTDRYEELDRFQVIEGHDSWGPIAVADGYLLMRDSRNLLCLDMRK